MDRFDVELDFAVFGFYPWPITAKAFGMLAILCRSVNLPLILALALTEFGLHSALRAAAGEPELRKEAVWQWPSLDSYHDYLSSYLDQVQASEQTRSQVRELWGQGAQFKGPALLDHLLDSAALVEPRILDLATRLRSPESGSVVLKDLPWLTSDVPGWLQDVVRLACGRAYAQRRMYDEALETLAGLELSQVCDPASLLFYRASAEHHLLKKKECLDNVKLLLQREQELPTRYRQVAVLMQSDIAPLEQDSLDEISRMMTDVQRRLELGRAGQKVRDEEENIVKKLDKIIEQIEEQAQQMMQQQQAAQQQNQQQSSQQPLDESQVAGGSGPGDVDAKKLEDRGGWGNLPPAQRQEALQRLTEELPTHYRDVIEGYFRQLAKDRPR